MNVALYGRPGCHLCDDARAMLERAGVAYDERNIEADDELFRRYLERIPVIVIDGEEAFELVVDEHALGARLGTLAGS
ncbi:MAG: glutaredoxin family protein [Solirubrobacteraceae bacterium]